MRKIIFQNMLSIDGYFEGPNKEIDWHNVDNEFNEMAIEFLRTLDYLLFGRVTYELMAGYWPTEAAKSDDPIVARLMNKLTKIVVSKSLNKVDWNNSKLLKENIEDEILKLKNENGKDIAIFGSSKLALSLIPKNLIDEYRLLISPVVLGKGNSLFNGLKERLKLKLIKSQTFKSGNVMLVYVPIK